MCSVMLFLGIQYSDSTIYALVKVCHFYNKPLALKLLHISYLSPDFNDSATFSPKINHTQYL